MSGGIGNGFSGGMLLSGIAQNIGGTFWQAGFVYVLDLLSTYPAVAYSVRALTENTYRRPYCMLVRRSSDNATLNIGYVNGVLDVVSLLAFVGSGNGYVVTWYNQGSLGSAGDATQSTAASQPQIVASGVVETWNGLPSVYFSGGSISLATSSLSTLPVGTASKTLSLVAQVGTASGNQFAFAYGPNTGSGQVVLLGQESGAYVLDTNTTSRAAGGSPVLGDKLILTGIYTSSTLYIYRNGLLLNSSSSAGASTGSPSQLGLGNWPANGAFPWNGYESEAVLWGANISATSDKSTYDLNAAAFYSIAGVTQ